MGFLDGKDRIQDVILTREGRKQYAEGRLNIRYFALFDDEIDYSSPLYNTGSLTAEQLEERRVALIEDTPVLEACFGKLTEESSDADFVASPRSFLFDMPQGQDVLPATSVFPNVTSSIMDVKQAIMGELTPGGTVGVMREKVSVLRFGLDLTDGKPDEKGMRIRVFLSGSTGLQEIEPMLDFHNEYSYGLHLKVYPDREELAGASKLIGAGKKRGT